MATEWQGDEFLSALAAALNPAMVEIGEVVRTEAVRLITDTPKTGAIYTRGGVSHQASAPGEAPATDSGNLVSRIESRPKPADNSVSIVSQAEYSAPLEFGTARMEARPFMRPALANTRDIINAKIKAAVTSVVKK